MVALVKSFGLLKAARVLVVGDLMLDHYTHGVVSRISPEAPVPVLHVHKHHDCPGGAGNVMLNLKALGAHVYALGCIGEDSQGVRLRGLLQNADINVDGIFSQSKVCTPVKNRLIAGGQQLIRVDQEEVSPVSKNIEQQLIDYIYGMINSIDIVAISDYAKGLLSERVLRAVIDISAENDVPTIVDPKGVDFKRYLGVTCIKPNYTEALLGAGLDDKADLNAVGASILNLTQAQQVLITQGAHGIFVFQKDQATCNYPARVREVIDVTGAGDTVLAMYTIAYASKLDVCDSVPLCNIAAAVAVERLGCASVTASDVAARVMRIDHGKKYFCGSNLAILEHAFINRWVLVLLVHENDRQSIELFAQIQNISKKYPDYMLMVCVNGDNKKNSLCSVLESFQEVNVVVNQSPQIFTLLQRLDQIVVYSFKDGNFLEETLASCSN